MNKIGIISESKADHGFLLFRRKLNIKHVYLHEMYTDIFIVELPYTVDKMYHTKEEKLQRYMVQAIDMLMELGVYKAVFTRGIKEIFDADIDLSSFKIFSGQDLFCYLIPQALKRASKKTGVSTLSSRIGISDLSMSSITDYLIDKLCFESKYISIYTENKERAESVQQQCFNELGLALELESSHVKTAHSDIFIDVDQKKLRIGRDLIIDGVELDMNLDLDYDVDYNEITACAEADPNKLKIKYLLNKKKRLTI